MSFGGYILRQIELLGGLNTCKIDLKSHGMYLGRRGGVLTNMYDASPQQERS